MNHLELVLIRHGETDWSREGRSQGHSQNPINELGIRQARRLAARLDGAHFDRIYSSDLERATQTAELVFPGQKLELNASLREISRGVLEGKIEAELTPSEREQRDALEHDRWNYRPPEGESFQDVNARVGRWLDTLPASGRIAAVCHGGVIRTVLYRILHHPESWDALFSLENTGITQFQFAPESAIVVRVNDYAHLEGFADLCAGPSEQEL